MSKVKIYFNTFIEVETNNVNDVPSNAYDYLDEATIKEICGNAVYAKFEVCEDNATKTEDQGSLVTVKLDGVKKTIETKVPYICDGWYMPIKQSKRGEILLPTTINLHDGYSDTFELEQYNNLGDKVTMRKAHFTFPTLSEFMNSKELQEKVADYAYIADITDEKTIASYFGKCDNIGTLIFEPLFFNSGSVLYGDSPVKIVFEDGEPIEIDDDKSYGLEWMVVTQITRRFADVDTEMLLGVTSGELSNALKGDVLQEIMTQFGFTEDWDKINQCITTVLKRRLGV